MATLFVMVGLPAAGKTTVGRRLASEHAAIRLTPDEWMIPLFGDPEAEGKRDVLEGRLITLALQLLPLGVDVVLDFGCWSRDERSALRSLARRSGASFRLVYLSMDRATQLQRIAQRWRQAPTETFEMTVVEPDRWQEQFEIPDSEELAGARADDPPTGCGDWLSWAQYRWPSLSPC